MTVSAIIVIALVIAVIAALALTRIAPDAILVAGLTALLVIPVPTATGWTIGILTPALALSGFSNPGVATVGVLFVVVAGLKETGSIDWIAERFLGQPRSVWGAVLRIVAPTSFMSAFLNNTPVVAMLIPAVADWARKLRIAPSKLMIPLSYAAIIGGTCSLIGTSTNLVVAGLVIDQTDLRPLQMFDITWVGLPCAVLGAAFLILAGPILLPSRGSAASLLEDPRQYSLEMMIPATSPLAGKTVEKAGLRNLPGCFLVEIDRAGDSITAPGPDQTLMAGDRLRFAGVVDSIRDLQNLRGLAPATDQVFKLDSPRFRRRLIEAVISDTCPIAGKTIREGRFRSRYDGAVIAVARNAERVSGKIGDIALMPGDTLLIEADPSFTERHRHSRDFFLIRALEDSTPRRHARAPLAIAILVLMIALASANILPMLVAALVASGLMVITRCCTLSEARRSVDWSLLIVIGASLALGKALSVSGAASAVATAAIAAAGSHPWLLLAAVYAITCIASEALSNNAAVALVFPFAHAAAEQLGVNFMPFVIAIMMAGSAAFATPLGYQTHLMVYGPGGYRFSDFFRIGIPMDLLIGAAAIGLTPLVFPFN